MNQKRHDLRDSERVREWDSETVGDTAGCRLSAVGLPLSAGLYSRKQEGSGACGARVQGLAGAAPLEASGSAHRAGWFRGSYKAHSVEVGWAPEAPFYNAPEGRHQNPLNLLNLLNLLNPLNPAAFAANFIFPLDGY